MLEYIAIVIAILLVIASIFGIMFCIELLRIVAFTPKDSLIEKYNLKIKQGGR